MRKILFIVWGLCYALTHTQAQTYTAIQDSLYQYLDKSRIESGVLYDRVFSWSQLRDYKETDTLKHSFIRQSWHELYLSDYNNKNQLSIEDVEDRTWRNQQAGNTISLGYINMTIQYIDSQAFDNGALVFDLNDSLPRDGDLDLNPYISKNILLPYVSVQHISETHPVFYFDPELKFSNNEKLKINKIYLEVEGQKLELSSGESGSLDFSGMEVGKILLWITLQFVGGGMHTFPYLIGWGTPEIITASSTSNLCTSDSVTQIWSGDLLTFKGYDETIATQGKVEFMIFYKLNDLD